MIGIVVVTHSRLGEAFLEAAEFILGSRPQGAVSVSIDLNQNVDRLREKVAAGIKKVSQDQGVLILTDMFGGTPSNLGLTFLEADKVEVITGVNLPMLIKLAGQKKSANLLTVARDMREEGRNAIWIASDLLRSETKGET